MAQIRTRFGLRDCATDDEAASGKQDSDSLEDFSESDENSDEVEVEATQIIKPTDSGKPALDRVLSWGRDEKPGDVIMGKMESVRILEKPMARRGSQKLEEPNGGKDVAGQVWAKEMVGENGKRRQRRKESWADMIDGDDDEDEFDAVIDRWASGGGEWEKGSVGEDSDSELAANEGVTDSLQDGHRKGVVSKINEPYNVPTSGTFYLHDDRWEEQPMRGRGRGRGRGFQPREQKWRHDKFEELEKGLDYQRRREINSKDWKKKPYVNIDMDDSGPKQKLPRQPKYGQSQISQQGKIVSAHEATTNGLEGLPQGVSYDQLKVTRGGKRISHQTRRGPSRSFDGIAALNRQEEHTQRVQGAEKNVGRAGHRRRGSRGSQSSQQNSRNAIFGNRRSPSNENGGHKRSSSVDDRSRVPRGSDQADWRTPSADRPVRHQIRLPNQKRENGVHKTNGDGQPPKSKPVGAGTLSRKPPGSAHRPTHRRGYSEGNWQQARLPSLTSPKFQLNPNALPFQIMSMNPDATPFVPPDTIQACASSIQEGL